MLRLAEEIVASTERMAASGASLQQVLSRLRAIDIDSFGLLMLSMPNAQYPALSNLLPGASTEEMDRHLTGDTGISLLQKSLRFTRALEAGFRRHTGRSMLGARVLDYGYGYGRLTRLMLHTSDPINIFGCDVAQRSLDWARELRLPGHYALISETPSALPFGGVNFDIIYAFSVFTHLSDPVTRAALSVLVDSLAPDGMMALTIRPIEFWQSFGQATPQEAQALMANHAADGFAFRPHLPYSSDFGDTSMSLAWLAQACPEMDVVGYDWGIIDPHQLVIFLRPNWRFPRQG